MPPIQKEIKVTSRTSSWSRGTLFLRALWFMASSLAVRTRIIILRVQRHGGKKTWIELKHYQICLTTCFCSAYFGSAQGAWDTVMPYECATKLAQHVCRIDIPSRLSGTRSSCSVLRVSGDSTGKARWAYKPNPSSYPRRKIPNSPSNLHAVPFRILCWRSRRTCLEITNAYKAKVPEFIQCKMRLMGTELKILHHYASSF